jgi:hypothetical protein
MDEEVPDLDDAMGKVGPGRKALQHVPDPVGIASDSLLETVGVLVNFIYHSFPHRVITVASISTFILAQILRERATLMVL